MYKQAMRRAAGRIHVSQMFVFFSSITMAALHGCCTTSCGCCLQGNWSSVQLSGNTWQVEQFYILGYKAVQSVESQSTFWKNISPTSLVLKNRPSKKQARSGSKQSPTAKIVFPNITMLKISWMLVLIRSTYEWWSLKASYRIPDWTHRTFHLECCLHKLWHILVLGLVQDDPWDFRGQVMLTWHGLLKSGASGQLPTLPFG
jgi:hypothetical protein